MSRSWPQHGGTKTQWFVFLDADWLSDPNDATCS